MAGTFSYRDGASSAYTTVTACDTAADVANWANDMNTVENGNNFTGQRRQGANIHEFDRGTGFGYMRRDLGAGGTIDFNNTEVSWWWFYTGKAAPEVGTNANSVVFRAYSDATPGVNFVEWNLGGDGADGTYPEPLKSWNPYLISGTNPDVTGGTGVTYTAIRHLEFRFEFNGGNTGNDPDFAMDWVKYGDRIRVTAGTSVTPADMDALFDWNADPGTTNPTYYGLCFKSDIYFDMWAGLEVGDGTTATYFAMENQIYYNYQFSDEVEHNIDVLNNATLRIGKKDVGTDATYAISGCTIVCPTTLRDDTTGARYSNITVKAGTLSKAEWYASKFFRWKTISIGESGGSSGTSEIVECDFDSNDTIELRSSNLTITDSKFHDPSGSGYIGDVYVAPSSVSGMKVFNCTRGFNFHATMTIEGYEATDNTTDIVGEGGITVTFRNSFFDNDKILQSGGTGALTCLKQYGWRPRTIKGSTAENGVKVYVFDSADTNVVNATTTGTGDEAGKLASVQWLQNASLSITTTTTTPTSTTPHDVRLLKWGLNIEQITTTIVDSVAAGTTPDFFVEDNNNITESTKATVDAYTGITVNHTTDTITLDNSGITPITTMEMLYDRLQSESIDTPQASVAEIMSTVAGSTYTMNYDLVINGFTFNGQSKSISMASGKTITFGTTGRADDLNVISGNVTWNTSTTMDNLDIAGTLFFDSNVTVGCDNCQIGTVDTVAGETVTMNLTGDSTTPTNLDPTNITITQAVTVTINVNDGSSPIQNAQTAVHLLNSPFTEIMNEDTTAAGVATESYTGSTPVDVVVKVRKSETTDDPRYTAYSSVQTIGTGGLTLTVTLEESPILT